MFLRPIASLILLVLLVPGLWAEVIEHENAVIVRQALGDAASGNQPRYLDNVGANKVGLMVLFGNDWDNGPRVGILDSSLVYSPITGSMGVDYTGISGLPAVLNGKFNTPSGTTSQYVRGDGSLATLPSGSTGTVTGVTAGTGLSGGTITTSGTISLPNVGTADTYSGITTDAQGRVTAGTKRAVDNNPGRSLNSTFTVSRDTTATYSINVSWTIQALLSGTASAFLEYSTDAGSNWTTVSQVSKTIGLLTFSGNDDLNLQGYMPSGALCRIRSTSTNMNVSLVRQQEAKP